MPTTIPHVRPNAMDSRTGTFACSDAAARLVGGVRAARASAIPDDSALRAAREPRGPRAARRRELRRGRSYAVVHGVRYAVRDDAPAQRGADAQPAGPRAAATRVDGAVRRY